jgi:hypothetical protein
MGPHPHLLPPAAASHALRTRVLLLPGIGVGGEYPVASASANERAEASEELRERRGETVVATFSMQAGLVSEGGAHSGTRPGLLSADGYMHSPSY